MAEVMHRSGSEFGVSVTLSFVWIMVDVEDRLVRIFPGHNAVRGNTFVEYCNLFLASEAYGWRWR